MAKPPRHYNPNPMFELRAQCGCRLCSWYSSRWYDLPDTGSTEWSPVFSQPLFITSDDPRFASLGFSEWEKQVMSGGEVRHTPQPYSPWSDRRDDAWGEQKSYTGEEAERLIFGGETFEEWSGMSREQLEAPIYWGGVGFNVEKK